MKTDVIVINSQGEHMESARQQTEKVAAYKGLTKKNALHLRLLVEEMMGMMRSITGEVEGQFWIEDEDGVYKLHLLVETGMTAKKREKLISASTSGQNEASRGLMGKIRSFFEPEEDQPTFFIPSAFDSPEMLGDTGWSMFAYREQLEQYIREQRDGADDAWDELDKSVISHVADDVLVSIRGRKVEMVIVKKFA